MLGLARTDHLWDLRWGLQRRTPTPTFVLAPLKGEHQLSTCSLWIVTLVSSDTGDVPVRCPPTRISGAGRVTAL